MPLQTPVWKGRRTGRSPVPVTQPEASSMVPFLERPVNRDGAHAGQFLSPAVSWDEFPQSPSFRIRGDSEMNSIQDRRNFLKSTAAIGVGAWIAGPNLALAERSANEEINIACIGVG